MSIMTNRRLEAMAFIQAAMEALNLPPGLQDRIMSYHGYIQKHHNPDTYDTLMNGLSRDLFVEMKLFIFGRLLDESPMLADLEEVHTAALVQAFQEIVVSPGDCVLAFGEEGDSMYFVIKGQVDVFGEHGGYLCSKKPGDYFGEVALIFANQKRMAWVVAKTFCVLARLDRPSFDTVFDMCPEKKAAMVTRMQALPNVKTIFDDHAVKKQTREIMQRGTRELEPSESSSEESPKANWLGMLAAVTAARFVAATFLQKEKRVAPDDAPRPPLEPESAPVEVISPATAAATAAKPPATPRSQPAGTPPAVRPPVTPGSRRCSVDQLMLTAQRVGGLGVTPPNAFAHPPEQRGRAVGNRPPQLTRLGEDDEHSEGDLEEKVEAMQKAVGEVHDELRNVSVRVDNGVEDMQRVAAEVRSETQGFGQIRNDVAALRAELSSVAGMVASLSASLHGSAAPPSTGSLRALSESPPEIRAAKKQV